MQTINLADGTMVWIDFELDKSQCKYCHKKIFWASALNGHKIPVMQNNGSYERHFTNCPRIKDRYGPNEYKPLTNGVDTDERKIKNLSSVQ